MIFITHLDRQSGESYPQGKSAIWANSIWLISVTMKQNNHVEKCVMATLKDVARLAGVSVSTVSIIVNGKATERNISLSTHQKVMAAINSLGYRPNLNARRIRYAETSRPRLVLFWPFDSRTNILSPLLTEIHLQLHKIAFDCELVIQTYDNNNIGQSSKEIINNSYSGIIVGGASQKDIEYLESLTVQVPIILINRDSQKLSTVCVEAKDIARSAINLLKQQAIKQVGVVGIKNAYIASNKRTQIFIEYCQKEHISISPNQLFSVENTHQEGMRVAQHYLTLEPRSKTIFCESEIVALGMLAYFHKTGVTLPDVVSLISVGTLGNNLTQYSIPSVTTVEVPTKKIARALISLLIEKLQSPEPCLPSKRVVKPITYIGETFPVNQ